MKKKLGTWILIFMFIGSSSIMLYGCGKKEGDEPTKYRSQAGLEKLSKQAAQKSTTVKSITRDNPKFNSSRDIKPESQALKNLDAVIRTVLIQQFGGAKIIAQNNVPVSDRADDLTLNSMQYVVRQMLNEDNVRALHAALKKANFDPNVRLGTKPTVLTSWAAMSFFKHTAGSTYSIALRIDFKKQIIKVESYKLGSKYDRMM